MMTLTYPAIITSRLMAGVKIGDTEISIGYSKRHGRDGRIRYVWRVDGLAGEFTGDDLQSGCQGGSLQEGLASLLSFLSAAGESFNYRGQNGENSDLFPLPLVEWCAQNSDELSVTQLDLEQNENAIQE